MKYPNRIKQLREEKGISQQKLAEEISISDSALQNYEYGIRDIPGGVIIKLCEFFNVTSDCILAIDDERSFRPELDGLQDIRIEKGISREKAAKDIGIPLKVYERWEDRTDSPLDHESLRKLADYFGVDPAELYGDDLFRPGDLDWLYPGSTVEIVEDTITVPLFGRIAAGVPLEMDAVEDHLQITRELFHRYPESFFLRVEGNSMDHILPDGCFALIDPSKKNENAVSGRIYALCINGYDATIKTVKKLANGYMLIPDSTDPTHRPQVFDYGVEGTDKITIIGEVVWYMVPPDYLSNYRYVEVKL